MTEPAFSLTSLIDEWIASREKKDYKSWRASALGACPRKHFLLRKGVEQTNPPDERTLRVFAAGDTFHKFVQDTVLGEKMIPGLLASAVEKEIYDEKLDLGGRYDLLVTTEDNKTILYDIKTVHSRAFWNMEREDKSVYPHHKVQLGAYALMLKRAGTPVDEMRMFYISKDDLTTREVTVLFTKELEDGIIAEVNLLNKHWAEDTLPPCTCEGWQISYCPFADPDSMNSVEVEAKSGKKYKKSQLTECCSDSLWKEKK